MCIEYREVRIHLPADTSIESLKSILMLFNDSMLLDLSQFEIYVRPGHTDMRKAINGLAVMVQDYMYQNPLSGSLYLFCNRQRRILKALYWDRNGFCLWQKKLEEHKFPWPMTEEDARQISSEQLSLLLKGIDFWHEHTVLKYSHVS